MIELRQSIGAVLLRGLRDRECRRWPATVRARPRRCRRRARRRRRRSGCRTPALRNGLGVPVARPRDRPTYCAASRLRATTTLLLVGHGDDRARRQRNVREDRSRALRGARPGPSTPTVVGSRRRSDRPSRSRARHGRGRPARADQRAFRTRRHCASHAGRACLRRSATGGWPTRRPARHVGDQRVAQHWSARLSKRLQHLGRRARPQVLHMLDAVTRSPPRHPPMSRLRFRYATTVAAIAGFRPASCETCSS